MSFVDTALKSIKKALKAAFIDSQYNALYPAPEVKAKLEKKGYKFEFYAAATGRFVTVGYDITSPEGRPVAQFGKSSAADTRQYRLDYERAKKECARDQILRHK